MCSLHGVRAAAASCFTFSGHHANTMSGESACSVVKSTPPAFCAVGLSAATPLNMFNMPIQVPVDKGCGATPPFDKDLGFLIRLVEPKVGGWSYPSA